MEDVHHLRYIEYALAARHLYILPGNERPSTRGCGQAFCWRTSITD